MTDSNSTTESIPLLDISSKRTLGLCQSYSYRSVDPSKHRPTIFIASYPKSGTTWSQAILYYLLSNNAEALDHISSYSPFYEVDKTWDEHTGSIHPKYAANFDIIGHNVFNTHLLPSIMPKIEEDVYAIYVMRHPYDVIVSFYHHLTNQIDGYDGSFREFLELWVQGKIIYGKWVQHIRKWVEAANSHVLILRYEDMKADIFKSIKRISEFLKLDRSDEIISAIVPKITFDGMKKDKEKYQPVSVAWKEGHEFLRKGEVGDGATLVGPEEAALIREMILSEFNGEYPEWFPYKL